MISPTSLYYDECSGDAQCVLAAMEKNDVKNIIFTSSVAVYGLNKTTLMKIILTIPSTTTVKASGKRKKSCVNGMPKLQMNAR
jgi:UDP-glucose 4-epimerase